MKRYSCTVGDKRGEFGLCMETCDEGKFITYESHRKVVQELSEKIKRLENELGKVVAYSVEY